MPRVPIARVAHRLPQRSSERNHIIVVMFADRAVCDSSKESVIGGRGKVGVAQRPAEPARNVAAEIELALVDQPHDADRGHHLADRGDANGIVDRHPPPGSAGRRFHPQSWRSRRRGRTRGQLRHGPARRAAAVAQAARTRPGEEQVSHRANREDALSAPQDQANRHPSQGRCSSMRLLYWIAAAAMARPRRRRAPAVGSSRARRRGELVGEADGCFRRVHDFGLLGAYAWGTHDRARELRLFGIRRCAASPSVISTARLVDRTPC